MTLKNLRRKCLLLATLVLSAQLVFAQGRTIQGKVTDARDGSPLPGVTVRVKEASDIGTVSGADGSYKLQVPSSAKTLVFSYVGYSALEVPITGTTLNAKLSSGKNLEEIVVIGYGTQKAKDVSAAVASISTKDFNKGIVTNPMQQIQGKVSGLVITQPGGDPNQSVIIRLRGQTSLTGGQTPLIVVDGVPLDDPSQIANIPPGDIASYDVLKDASAAAIYGSRGANGVILINTKKGQAGKAQVTYSGYVGMDHNVKKYDLLNVAEWRAADKQLGFNDISGYEKGGNTDWWNAITRTAYTHSHNLAVSGGTGEFNYRASASYINQQGIVINSDKEETGLRFNAEQKAMNDRLDIQAGLVNTQANRKYTDYNNLQYVFSTPPTYPVKNADGSYFAFIDFAQANPVMHLMQELNTGKEYLTQMYGTVNYKLIDDLTIGTTGSLSHFNKQTDWFLPAFPVEKNLNSAAKYSENHDEKRGDIHLNFLHEWGLHNFGATVVYEYNDFGYNNYSAGGQQYIVDLNQDNALQNGNGAFNAVNSYQDEYTLISFLGRATYNYNGKYYVEAGMRRDGSSKFGVNNRWGNFPFVSVAWRLSQEGFMKNLGWINDFKLRAGWGITGNQDAIDPYNTQLLLGSVGRYYNAADKLYPYPQAYAPKQNANPDLKWEARIGRNIGADFSLFNNRVNGDINVFNDKTKNLLYKDYKVPVPPFYVDHIIANVGSLYNKGVEIALNGDVVKGPHFSWNLGGQISFIRTKVTNLSGTYAGFNLSAKDIPGGYAEGRGLSNNPITLITTGYAPYVFWLPHYVGVNANGEQLFSDGKGGTVTQGHLTDDMKQFIDPTPKFNYGINNTLTYDNWGLNLFFRGVSGQKIFNNTLLDVENVNRLPGNNVTKEALTNGIKDAAVASDHWLENASYLRLDNITLSYTFRKISGIQQLQLYLSGNNVFVITPYRGLDPEIRVADSNQSYIDATYGGDGYYPRTRSFSFGVNVSFN